MHDPETLERMRSDWNQRAGEDANYYVAFGRREQEDEEFFASGAAVVRALDCELPRLRARHAALEIGCGPGRLMLPMSRRFDEVHGVDVSDEMVRLAGQRLRGAPNAYPRVSSGGDLADFPEDRFDFVYSYAVFQHIPSREVVFNYLREARRVLKTGGILRCQINGLPQHAKQYDTWNGVRVSPDEVRRFAREDDFQLLALEGVSTQYMWTTWRKMPSDWTAGLEGRSAPSGARIRSVGNALTGEGVAPSAGPMAAISLRIEGLHPDCDLNHLGVRADGRGCRLTYRGDPGPDGVSLLNAMLPEGVRAGLLPVEVEWLGSPVCAPGWIRVIPAGPAVPRLMSVTDGINLLSGARIVSGSVKVTMEHVARPEAFQVTVDGLPGEDVDSFQTDPLAARFEINFALPKGLGPGAHEIRIALGNRKFPPVAIEVA